MNYEKLGYRLRQQRELSSLTQGELASKVGVTGSFIGQIERGQKKASLDTIVALCNALEISPTLLLQDSLNEAAIASQMTYEAANLDLLKGIVQVLREHKAPDQYY